MSPYITAPVTAGEADRLNLHLNVNVTEPQPCCGSNQIASQGIVHTYKHVRADMYCTYKCTDKKHTTPALSKLPVFKENRALQWCSGVCIYERACVYVCMYGGLV